jgi:hypothetical protein
MTLGPIAFLSPWLLAGLLALPVIWWLLRTIPPRPRRLEFPPTRILVGIENREKTPAQTPWWLTLIRMLAAEWMKLKRTRGFWLLVLAVCSLHLLAELGDEQI